MARFLMPLENAKYPNMTWSMFEFFECAYSITLIAHVTARSRLQPDREFGPLFRLRVVSSRGAAKVSRGRSAPTSELDSRVLSSPPSGSTTSPLGSGGFASGVCINASRSDRSMGAPVPCTRSSSSNENESIVGCVKPVMGIRSRSSLAKASTSLTTASEDLELVFITIHGVLGKPLYSLFQIGKSVFLGRGISLSLRNSVFLYSSFEGNGPVVFLSRASLALSSTMVFFFVGAFFSPPISTFLN